MEQKCRAQKVHQPPRRVLELGSGLGHLGHGLARRVSFWSCGGARELWASLSSAHVNSRFLLPGTLQKG